MIKENLIALHTLIELSRKGSKVNKEDVNKLLPCLLEAEKYISSLEYELKESEELRRDLKIDHDQNRVLLKIKSKELIRLKENL